MKVTDKELPYIQDLLDHYDVKYHKYGRDDKFFPWEVQFQLELFHPLNNIFNKAITEHDGSESLQKELFKLKFEKINE